jgi:hypothetical protein
MGIFRGKRKKGLRLSIYRKPSTYVSKNEKPMTTALHAFSSPSYSPDNKKSRWLSPSPRHFESLHNVLLSTPKNVNDLERQQLPFVNNITTS